MSLRHCLTVLIVIGSVFLVTESISQASVVSGSVSTSKTSYTVGAGKNRLIIVAVSQERNPLGTVSSITWGGQPLTLARAHSSATFLRGEIWYLNEAGISAARGSCSYNFVVTWSAGPTNEVFTAFTLKDIDQTTPVAAVNSAEASATNLATGNIAVGINDLVVYASASTSNKTHTPAASYTEQSDQIIGGGGGTSMATATRAITIGGTENPTATWSGGAGGLINVGVAFNGITSTSSTTYYSRNATLGGIWDSPNSWTLNSDGSGGPLSSGVWPDRTDNVVISIGHTITINATDDNKSCGVSPDGLALSNVGPFTSSNIAMFYQTGDITISGTLSVTGIEMLVAGYTHVLTGGTFSLASNLVNVGYLEADASSTLSSLDDLVLTGSSTAIINTNSTSTDDLIIDHTDATLCGIGAATLQNGAGSQVTYANSATVNQICTTFTVNCTGGGCSGFPVTGTGNGTTGNTGPGGVGNSTTNKLWLMANQLVYTDAGTTLATDNQTVQQWNDLSGNTRNASELTNKPTLRTNIVNGFPVIRYDNTDRLLSTGLTTANSASVYVVAQYTSLPPSNPGLIQGSPSGLGFDTGPTNKCLGMWVNSAGTPWGRIVQTNNTQVNIPQVTGLSVSTFFTLSNIISSSSLTVNQYVNNTISGSIAYDGTLKSWTDFGIGRQGTETWNGDISEVIVYNVDLNMAQRALVSNYLAAKYATTLSAPNDLYTMDNVGNGNFDYEVAGIGQATDGSNHKDARGPGIVRMTSQSPSSLSNDEYLIWGHNNATLLSNLIDVDGTIIEERITRVWRLSETGDVGSVAVSFDISSLTGSPIGSNLRLLIDRDGDGFADNDVTPINGGTFTGDIITFTGVNFQSGDRFTLGNTDLSNPLPIELLSFSALAEHIEVKLKWSTASEFNNDYFTVQRSQDVEKWQDVIEISAAGNSNERIDYETTDGLPFSGISYYRLKQTDFDGKYSYSYVRRVEINPVFQLKVYPNPSSGNFQISTGFEIQPSDVRLTNLLGQPVPITMEAYGSSMIVSLGSVSTGIYFLQVNRGYWKQTVRVVVE